jgi:predicted Zn-dependent protease
LSCTLYYGPQPEPIMSEPPSCVPPSLIMLQFLAWVADRPRTYADTMAAWRSTCPRLSVWEDAVIDGLVRVANEPGRSVRLTPRGRTALQQNAEAP